jgi:uncharacterized membrane protein YphA (DoxX/SURF4 family)
MPAHLKEARMPKWQNVTLWILQSLLAALYLFSGISKLIGHPEITAAFEKFGYPMWFATFIGVAETLGGVALLVPRVIWLGSAGLSIIMLGAMYSHLKAGDPAGETAFTAVLAVLLAAIAWMRRPK